LNTYEDLIIGRCLAITILLNLEEIKEKYKENKLNNIIKKIKELCLSIIELNELKNINEFRILKDKTE